MAGSRTSLRRASRARTRSATRSASTRRSAAKNRIYGRYTADADREDSGHAGEPDEQRRARTAGAKQAMLADTHTFSPTRDQRLAPELHARALQQDGGPAVGSVQRHEPEYRIGTAQHHQGRLADVQTVCSRVVAWAAAAARRRASAARDRPTWTIAKSATRITDIVYKSHGTMSLKFGVDISHALQNVIPLYGAFGGIYAFAATQTNSTGTSTGTGGVRGPASCWACRAAM